MIFGMILANDQVVWRFPVTFQIGFGGLSMGLLLPLPDTELLRYQHAEPPPAGTTRKIERWSVTLFWNSCTWRLYRPTNNRHEAGSLASLELEKANDEGLRIREFLWEMSTTQPARRIKPGMIYLALAYLQAWVTRIQNNRGPFGLIITGASPHGVVLNGLCGAVGFVVGGTL